MHLPSLFTATAAKFGILTLSEIRLYVSESGDTAGVTRHMSDAVIIIITTHHQHQHLHHDADSFELDDVRLEAGSTDDKGKNKYVT